MKKWMIPLLLLAGLVSLSGCRLGSHADSAEFTPGTWKDSSFESEFLALQFTLPDGWTAQTEAELEAMSSKADSVLDMQKGGDGENPGSVFHYELSVKDPETGAGVLILVQQYNYSTSDYESGLESGSKAEGATYTVGTSGTRDLAGHRYLVIPVTMEDQEAPYQRQYVRKEGNYLVQILLFSSQEGQSYFDDLEANFSELLIQK